MICLEVKYNTNVLLTVNKNNIIELEAVLMFEILHLSKELCRKMK